MSICNTYFSLDTCHCERKIFCNWYEAKPYVFIESNTKLAGLFPNLIRDIVMKACGSCSGYENSTLSYFSSKDGSEPNKKSELKLKSSIADGVVDISFPVFGRAEESVIFPGTEFIPIVQSPGSAMIIRDQAETQNKALELMKSVLNTWPMFAITFMLAFITGYFIWFTVSRANKRYDFIFIFDKNITVPLHILKYFHKLDIFLSQVNSYYYTDNNTR